MLGLELTGERAVPHGLPVRASSATPTARRCRRRRATSSTRSAVIDEIGRRRAAVRADPRRDAGQRPAVRAGQARERAQLREQALERDPLRRRARGRRRSPTDARTPAARRRPTSDRPSAGSCRARPRRPRRVDAAMAELRASARSPALLYDAIWSEFCDWGLELAKVRLADESLPADDARGDVVDAGRGARHVPAPAPPGHAVRHRGALGRAAASRGDPELLIVARWPARGRARRGGRGGGRRAHRARPRDPQRPRRGAAAGRPTGSRRSSTCRRRSARPSRRSGRRSNGWPAPGRSTAS